ncbi:hypothetical protein D4R87_03195 [bacterium]|nr:MAG: hypothetical protein D4R87_03195 [bacterium]
MDIKVKKGDYLDILLRSPKTVFSTKDVALLWRDSNLSAARVRLSYYVKKGKLIRLRRGLYVKDKNYNKYELATSILRPSYISFETVMGATGMTFQHYEKIFVASYVKRDLICDGHKFSFQKVKNSILINPKGMNQKEEYSIASKERAFLDIIYRSGDYHFDNLSFLDWEKVFEILPIYGIKKIEERVKEYFEYYKLTK